jgi:signal transduction histidine kinase
MRIVPWLLGALVCILCGGAPASAHATVVALDQARAALTVNGESQLADVKLPYGWDFHHAGAGGLGQFALRFDAPTSEREPWALYFYRLGNAYVVRLNGVVLEQNGTLGGAHSRDDYAKIPHFVRIPASVLLPHNQLDVTIRSDGGRRSGMPVVWVGPTEELEPLYWREFVVRVAGGGVLTVFSLMVGAFAFVLWISQTDPRPERRGVRDNLYLFAAMAEFSWAFIIGDTLIERPPLPWSSWSVVINMMLGIWLSSLLMFCHTIAGWQQHPASRAVRNALVALIVIGPALAYGAITASVPLLLTCWQAGFAVVFIPSAVLFIAQALRQATPMHKVVALAFLVNVPVGMHDFYVTRIADPFGSHVYMRYSATLFGLVLGAIAIARFRRANLHVRDLLDTLALRIEDKDQELSQTYQRMERVAREQERVLERSRILRDMHDGVGSHISSAIRQLQSGNSSHDEILLTLQDSLDQLKLSIDALNLPPGDVTALLANLRYRLEPRFRSMGLALEWALVPLPVLPHLDASAMRQLQFIFFEAFSNVMQHAQATVLRIEATPVPTEPGSVRIRICDNGRGFDTARVHRGGLVSMQERVLAIGAQVGISSQSGATVVELLLV